MKLRFPVRSRLLVIAGIAVLAVITALSWLIVHRCESILRAQLAREVDESARLLALALAEPAASGDQDEMARIVRSHLDPDAVVFVWVTDAAGGKLLVSESVVEREGAPGSQNSDPAAENLERMLDVTRNTPGEEVSARRPVLAPSGPSAGEPVAQLLVVRSGAHVDAGMGRLERATIQMAVVSLLLAISVVAFVFSQTVSGPIRRLRDAVRGEGVESMQPAEGRDELGELAVGFQEVSQQLKTAREQLGQKSKELERKNVELFQTSQYLESILSSSTDYAILAEDLEGRILSANEGARRTFGYPSDELEGRHLQQLLSDAERGIETVRDLYRRVMSGERDVACEINARHKDGRTFPASFSFSLRSYASGEPAGFVVIARDLTRDKEEQELILRNRELERASRLKSEFLANMSHELRTPLNSVIGFSEVLSDGFFGSLNEQQLEYINDIHNSGRHLLDLINDILDISKIEAGRMDLQREHFDVREAIERVSTMVSSQAHKKSITVTTEVSDVVPQLYADSGRFKQIILNLVSNAIKFTPEKGAVRIAVSHRDEAVRIVVEDNGIGIPPQYLPTIFDKFQQVEGGYRRSYGGTGLGLAIVKEFVELHGGRVWAESEVGKGSTFTLSFPDSVQSMKEAIAEEPGRDPTSGLPSEDSGSAVVSASAPAVTEVDESESEPQEPEATVLVVDDDPFTLKQFFRYLTPRYRVETAMTGALALELAQENPPDVITLKVFLPDLDGWEVLRCLKENPKTRRIPIVIVSSSGDEGSGFAVGASDYFVKPIPRNDLLSSLSAFALRVPGRDAPPRILVIDDNPKDIRLLESYLKPAGFELETARGGKEGIARIREGNPDVVVLDLLMPECSGFEVIEEVRRDSGRKMPILVLTNGYLSVDEKITLMEDIYSISSKAKLDREILLEEVARVLRSAPSRDARGSASRKGGVSG